MSSVLIVALLQALTVFAWTQEAKPLSAVDARPAPQLDALFQRTEGWIGADGAYSVALKPDRILWLFSDTWVGKVRDGKRAEATIVNNSIALQDGRGPAAKVRFFHGQNAQGKPAAWITPVDGRGWFWLQAGALVQGKLYLFLTQVEKSGKPGVFGFRLIGVWLGIVANPQDEPASWRIRQEKLPFAEFSQRRTLSFGAAALADGDFLYVYGFDEDGKVGGLGDELSRRMVLARAPADKVEDFAAWRFFGDGRWNSSAKQLGSLAGGFAPEFSVSYLRGGKRYVAVYTELGLSPRILARTAPAPWGPWSEPVKLYECPEMARDKKLFTYAAKAHPALSTHDELGDELGDDRGDQLGDHLVITYVVNSFDFWQVAADARLYWPRFVRVQWKAQTP